MDQSGVRSARQRTACRIACALFALLQGGMAHGQTATAQATGSVVIEPAVGGSLALETTKQAVTAVFQPRSSDSLNLLAKPVRKGASVYSALITQPTGQEQIYSGDADVLSAYLAFDRGNRRYMADFKGFWEGRDRLRVVLVLINFN